MDYLFSLDDGDITPEDISRHVTNEAEAFAFLSLFIVYFLIMVWHMQIFRRVFSIKGSICLIDPSKLMFLHLFILFYLISKISTCAYALIAGRIDYMNRIQLKENKKMTLRYYNISVYAALMSMCIFTQMTAYIVNIMNWLQIINRLKDQSRLRNLIKVSNPLILLTLIGQLAFSISIFIDDKDLIQKFGVFQNILNIVLVVFLSISSYYIYRFFQKSYSNGQQLSKAIIILNVGLQLKIIWILIGLCNPGMMQRLKNFDIETQTDATVSWAFVWSCEQILFSVMPTVYLIILARPLLFITERNEPNLSINLLQNILIVQEQLIKESCAYSDTSSIHQQAPNKISLSPTFSLNNNDIGSITVASASYEFDPIMEGLTGGDKSKQFMSRRGY